DSASVASVAPEQVRATVTVEVVTNARLVVVRDPHSARCRHVGAPDVFRDDPEILVGFGKVVTEGHHAYVQAVVAFPDGQRQGFGQIVAVSPGGAVLGRKIEGHPACRSGIGEVDQRLIVLNVPAAPSATRW